jgi:hypothetical protein
VQRAKARVCRWAKALCRGFGGVPQFFVLAQEQAEKQSVSDGSLRVSPNLQSPLGVGDQRGLKHE